MSPLDNAAASASSTSDGADAAACRRQPTPHPVRTWLTGVAAAIRRAKGVLDGVLGDDAYRRYVARHHAEHPDHEPMTEREFWRARDDYAENNVEGRCC